MKNAASDMEQRGFCRAKVVLEEYIHRNVKLQQPQFCACAERLVLFQRIKVTVPAFFTFSPK